MNTIYLSESEKVQLESQHKRARDGRDRDRMKAILLRSENWSSSDIAQALRIDESSVLRHLKGYENGQKLLPENGGSASYLDEARTAELSAHIESSLYQHNHLIVCYVEKRWGIKFSIPGMNKWLKRNGFVYESPLSLAFPLVFPIDRISPSFLVS